MEHILGQALSSFDTYFASFTDLTEQQKKNFRIKYDHSIRVSEICGLLADKLSLDAHDKSIAVIIGLFHDIGRFKQLIEYNTFNDAVSVDHAVYSVEVLQQENILADIDNAPIIYQAIQHHNKLKLPEHLTGKELFFAQLIRDADKLDILKVITDYYTAPNAPANNTLTWEMPTGETVSPKVAEQVLAGEQIARPNIKNELDIKVMQLSWVFDLNFSPSLEILEEKGYIDIIYDCMPKNRITDKIYKKVLGYMNDTNKCTAGLE